MSNFCVSLSSLSSSFIFAALFSVVILVLNRPLAVRAQYEFGQTYVVQPKGEHLATVVWLHGLTEDGYRWSLLLQALPTQNIKWICPTAPTRPVLGLGGALVNAWFDMGTVSADGFEDFKGLDASVAHVEDLLSKEPPNVKLGIGGFSQGCATSLYSTVCFAEGKYTNGNPFLVNLTAAAALSGWLPGLSVLKSKLTTSEAVARAASLPVLQGHGNVDPVVPYTLGMLSSQTMISAGFKNLTFKTYPGVGHFYFPTELEEVANWFKEKFGI